MLLLEKMCLNLIIEKFERFYFAFTVSKDKNLKRNFEFLQRRYSTELARELYEQSLYKHGYLKPEYLEILINEHLYFLQEEWIVNSPYRNSMEDIFRRLPNLTTIDFVAMDGGDELLKNIARFCSKIAEIRLRYPDVTDNGVKHLCELRNGILPCPELKNIFIKASMGSNWFTERGAEYLIRNLPSLEKFNYPTVPLLLHKIHEENLREFKSAHFYNLVELNFFELHNFSNIIHLPIYTDALKTCLTVCPKLESLSFYISDKEQLNLCTKSSLKKLRLACDYPNINIDDFLKKNGCKLTYLDVTKCTMSICALGVHCPNLREVLANRINFVDDVGDYDLKPNFSSLIQCYFTYIEASSNKAVCLLLSSSPKLESISFDSILSPEVKNQIFMWCKNPCAKIIKLCHINEASEMEFLEDTLLNCPSLKEMGLFHNSMYYYTHSEKVKLREKLQNLAKSLRNKPELVFQF